MKLIIGLIFLCIAQTLSSQNLTRAQANLPIDGMANGMARLYDLDLDGDLDMFVSGQSNDGSFLTLAYFNDGIGNFDPSSRFHFPQAQNTSFAIADVGGEGGLGDVFFYRKIRRERVLLSIS